MPPPRQGSGRRRPATASKKAWKTTYVGFRADQSSMGRIKPQCGYANLYSPYHACRHRASEDGAAAVVGRPIIPAIAAAFRRRESAEVLPAARTFQATD